MWFRVASIENLSVTCVTVACNMLPQWNATFNSNKCTSLHGKHQFTMISNRLPSQYLRIKVEKDIPGRTMRQTTDQEQRDHYTTTHNLPLKSATPMPTSKYTGGIQSGNFLTKQPMDKMS